MLLKDVIKPLKVKNILPLLEDIASHRQEHFVVMTLNNNNEVIKKHIVFIGTVNATIVHPREVFACALEDGAVSIAVAHNHPSDDPEPSRADIEMTQQLVSAGQILAIKLHDHIIVAGNDHYSFRENGMLPQKTVD